MSYFLYEAYIRQDW